MNSKHTELFEIIKTNSSFVITTHVNPDADAIGSQLALERLLKVLDKEVYCINHSYTPYNLLFLDFESSIKKYKPELHDELIEKADVIVMLDLNQLNRTVSMEAAISRSNAYRICIDHHENPHDIADLLISDTAACATGEIIFNLFKENGALNFGKYITEPIYAAIMTDTGSFRFDRTTPEVHRVTALLIENGADPNYIFDAIYDQSNPGRLRLLGKALTGLKISDSGKVCSIYITRKDLIDTGADESDVDGFVNYCLSVKGTEIGLLFYELRNGIKISFRSKGSIPINLLAKEFGGGGHRNAAGTRLFDANLDDYISRVEKRAEDFTIKKG